MSKKLYHVICAGMTTCIAGQTAHGSAYVVAENSEEAYRMVRSSLDKRDLGFSHEREMYRVELMAENTDYPQCGHPLYI